jgi:hypothetical protein
MKRTFYTIRDIADNHRIERATEAPSQKRYQSD